MRWLLVVLLSGCADANLPCPLDAGVNATACPVNFGNDCGKACSSEGLSCRYVRGSCESLEAMSCVAVDGGVAWSCPSTSSGR